MDTRLYITNTDALEDEALFRALYARMPAYRREKIDRHAREENKRQSLAVGALLAHALRNAGLPADLEISIGQWGKPAFTDFPQLRFNLSHGDNFALCLISPYNCGCDMERIRPDLPKAAKRISPPEQTLLQGLPEEQRPEAFTRIWVLKESLLKTTGQGFALGPGNFSFLPEETGLKFLPGDLKALFRFYEWPWEEDFRLACCLENAPEGLVLVPETVDLRTLI